MFNVASITQKRNSKENFENFIEFLSLFFVNKRSYFFKTFSLILIIYIFFIVIGRAVFEEINFELFVPPLHIF